MQTKLSWQKSKNIFIRRIAKLHKWLLLAILIVVTPSRVLEDEKKEAYQHITPGEFIEVSGTFRDVLGDFYISTQEGIHFLVLGSLDAVMSATLSLEDQAKFKEDRRRDLDRWESGLQTTIRGYYTALTDTGDYAIHALVVGSGEKWKNLSLSLLEGSPSPFPRGDFYILEPPEYSWEWTLDEMKDSSWDFMLKYLTYARKLEVDTQRYLNHYIESPGSQGTQLYSVYVRFAKWKAFMDNSPLYYSWRRSHARYRQQFMEFYKGRIDPANVYLRIVKNDYMIYAVEKGTERLIFAFPMSYGLHPDAGNKEGEDDWRTPETPDYARSYQSTPMRIGRRLGYSVRPGMITRNMGIESDRPEDKFWVKWGMNVVIHGSPNFASIGSRASHGCIRMLPNDAKELFELTEKGTPVVIQ
jgi:hypothetical protein